LALGDAHVVLADLPWTTVCVRSAVTGDGLASSRRATLTRRAVGVVAALLTEVVDAELPFVAVLIIVTLGVVRTTSEQS
jgi:hypothetical protein